MKLRILSFLLFLAWATSTSCNNNSTSKEDSSVDSTGNKKPPKITSYLIHTTGEDSTKMTWFAAYDDNNKGRRPIVLVVHEWWGLNDYIQNRAKQLAELGYFAFAVDMYGDGKVATTPDEARSYAMPFYKDPALAVSRLKEAWAIAARNPLADSTRIAGIGYCFGGGMLLNAAKMGMPFTGVVSFHGSLAGVPPKGPMKTKFLICHGQADKNVSAADIATFKKQMDSVGADYTFKEYAGATHAFTNPDATAVGKKFNMPIEYNAAADTASWNDMKEFLERIFK
jgi:dienelactone hydrolase